MAYLKPHLLLQIKNQQEKENRIILRRLRTPLTMDDTRRIVLLGKTGAGKSSLGNTLGLLGEKKGTFGRKVGRSGKFKTSDSANSVTSDCESKNVKINGRNVELIDTPGLFDTDPKKSDNSAELLKSLEKCADGVHAFLLVLKVERYTEHEQAVVDIILKVFSEEALKYTTVVFTHGDDLEDGKTIKDWGSENEALKNLVEKCGGRCHVFDNKRWVKKQDKCRYNKYQTKELLKTIDDTVEKNGGVSFTSEMMRSINTHLEQFKTMDWCYKWTEQTSIPALVLLAAFFGTVILVKVGAEWLLGKQLGMGVTVGAKALSKGWGWASERWGAPNETVKEATNFMVELEDLFKQVKKTIEAVSEDPKSSSCSIQ